MGNPDHNLIDAIITQQLDLRRYEAGVRANIWGILERMKGELAAKLGAAHPITEYNRERMTSLLRQINLLIDKYYTEAQGNLTKAVQAVADEHARQVGAAMDATVMVGAVLPTQAVLDRLGKTLLIQGGPMLDWWSRQSADTAFRMGNAIRQGAVQGETNQQIIQRLIGKRGETGIIDIARHNAAAVVQTAMQQVANDTRLAVFERNADVILRLEWFAAMDGHTCPVCIALNGKVWTNGLDGEHDPVGHNTPFQAPPIHWNDRCVLLPITRHSEDIPGATRASSIGPISAKTTFDQYLKRQPQSQQDEMLGKGRAQMWRDGKITLPQLIDGKGRELTLKQLQARY